jgi:hypothetical protein
MAGMRKAADDRSNMNKIYKPIAGYVGNVVKEVKDNAKAFSRAIDLQDKIRNYPPTKRPALKAAATANDKKVTAERGQLIGAIVKGARYDEKGKRK